MPNYVLIQRRELTQSAASVTFSNIPQTGFTDIKIVASTRGAASGPAEANRIYFNGDTTNTNYTGRRLLGSGSAASSDQQPGITAGFFNDLAGATSNIFANSEVYIPNYAASNSKSFLIDTMTENNGTEAYAGMVAVRWSGTAAITSITFVPESGNNFVANSTFAIYGLSATGTTPTTKAYGGDNVYTDGTYWYHIFTSSGTFAATQTLSCDYLVVAGGGGGGQYYSGGGGAGGYRTSIGGSPLSVVAGTYPVSVGAGGAGRPFGDNASGFNGNNSIFSTITSTGGGGGGSASSLTANSGGSGGGGNADGPTVGQGGAGNTPSTTPSQGNNGGNGVNGTSSAKYAGGGGGGAGAVGGNATFDSNQARGGSGGNGVANSITGTSVTYAGGGGGGSLQGGGTSYTAPGGSGGGGTGGYAANVVTTIAPTNGGTNLGAGGGGGVNYYLPYVSGGNGGSGIVVVRYAV